MADLTLRVPRRRRWWVDIDGLGVAGARRIEAFLSAHADPTDRARALLGTQPPSDVLPWEKLLVPQEVDGSKGLHRAPRVSCVLRANNDYEAVQAWLSLHEAPATQRAYRKEAERLILTARFVAALNGFNIVLDQARRRHQLNASAAFDQLCGAARSHAQ